MSEKTVGLFIVKSLILCQLPIFTYLESCRFYAIYGVSALLNAGPSGRAV
jgi:hypothetical protein